MYAEDLGSAWERDVTHRGAALKLACPGEGSVVSVLYRTGAETIGYSIPDTDRCQHSWPPDPTATVYGESCACGQCQGRIVGASVEVLIEHVIALSTTSTAYEDTFILRYLPCAPGANSPPGAPV